MYFTKLLQVIYVHWVYFSSYVNVQFLFIYCTCIWRMCICALYILLYSWGAEEYSLSGSREFVEEYQVRNTRYNPPAVKTMLFCSFFPLHPKNGRGFFFIPQPLRCRSAPISEWWRNDLPITELTPNLEFLKVCKHHSV